MSDLFVVRCINGALFLLILAALWKLESLQTFLLFGVSWYLIRMNLIYSKLYHKYLINQGKGKRSLNLKRIQNELKLRGVNLAMLAASIPSGLLLGGVLYTINSYLL